MWQTAHLFYSFLDSSNPPFRVAVFSSPPPLSSINRITIRLPSRFSAKLDNSPYSQLSLSGSMRPPLGCIHASSEEDTKRAPPS